MNELNARMKNIPGTYYTCSIIKKLNLVLAALIDLML